MQTFLLLSLLMNPGVDLDAVDHPQGGPTSNTATRHPTSGVFWVTGALARGDHIEVDWNVPRGGGVFHGDVVRVQGGVADVRISHVVTPGIGPRVGQTIAIAPSDNICASCSGSGRTAATTSYPATRTMRFASGATDVLIPDSFMFGRSWNFEKASMVATGSISIVIEPPNAAGISSVEASNVTLPVPNFTIGGVSISGVTTRVTSQELNVDTRATMDNFFGEVRVSHTFRLGGVTFTLGNRVGITGDFNLATGDFSLRAMGELGVPSENGTMQFLEIHPGQTSFSSRGSMGIFSGEALMGLHTTHWRGVGDGGVACEARGLRAVVQDQNSATQETYRIVIRTGSDTNGPTTGVGPDLLLRTTPVSIPQTPTGSINAWMVTTSLDVPQRVPCDSFYAWGIEVTASPNWTMDGMSIHTSFSTGSRPFHYSHPNGGDHAWEIVGNSPVALHPAGKMTWRLAMQVNSNILQMGADSNATPGRFRYGYAGHWPLQGRALGVRIQGNGTPATQSAPVMLAIGFASRPTRIFPNVSRLYVTPAPGLIVPIGTSSVDGDLTVEPLVPAGVLPAGPFPPIFMQAAYLSGSGNLTNADAVEIL